MAVAIRLVTMLTMVFVSGCALIQPSSRGAPIADLVGVGVMGAATTVAVVEMDRSARTGGPDFSADGGYTAGTCTLAGLTMLYAISAVYGFTRDAKTQYDEPIIGLQILALGLAGFGRGANNGGGHQGCCSYHGGTDHCEGERLICSDGATSPSCRCD